MRLLPSCCDCLLPPSWRAKRKTVLQYRMDELAKAFQAAHLAFDVLEDERQIAKLQKAERLAKQVHEHVTTPTHPALLRAHSTSSHGSSASG